MHKRRYIQMMLLLFLFISCKKQESDQPISFPVYEGNDLGVQYTPQKTTFKLWSPVAEKVVVHLYEKGLEGKPLQSFDMKSIMNGAWKLSVNEDLLGKYYTFQVTTKQGETLKETPGIYAKATGANGMRGMIVDMKATNPEGWAQDKRPPLKSSSDIILYELQIRDMSISPTSGSAYPGKYLGLAESGTTSKDGLSTGIDHIEEMGVTHAHILPAFDYHTVDETKLDSAQYNWGYDPQNYNVPEGSYATDPYDGAVRIKEFKQMVKAFHDKGIRVIMDVVYNHTFAQENAWFNQEVPDYYYRQKADGSYSDASACGNETASEQPMMRKYMIESLKYWAKEYHVDGFRFDLMGIHDITTMNAISDELKAMDPSIFLYGEGWTAGDSPLPVEERALKAHTYQMRGVAAFSDDIRDAIKGHYAEEKETGFVSGKEGLSESIKFGVVGATNHPQINYELVNYSDTAWASSPSQCINYVSCHDNHTLYDKLKASCPNESEAEIIKMHQLANTIVLTSQGVPFLHAGVEMLRTKNGEHNSYNLPDNINQIDWTRKKRYKEVVDYYKGLIAIRKAHPALHMPSQKMIQKHLKFLEFKNNLVAGFVIDGHANGDAAEKIMVLYNANKAPYNFNILKGKWKVLVNGKEASPEGLGYIEGGNITMPGRSAWVLVKE
ncbi:type I pullulanase [Algivirga pacifica]|uniref:Type I pullulanase n=1 Tax=Algivirga pacifica TaxID=1162670 RepID=A0ABP9DHS8_9BACT